MNLENDTDEFYKSYVLISILILTSIKTIFLKNKKPPKFGGFFMVIRFSYFFKIF